MDWRVIFTGVHKLQGSAEQATKSFKVLMEFGSAEGMAGLKLTWFPERGGGS